MFLPGASIAIDDCYELWESGFVSIPYDFEMRDLQPQLQELLQGARAESDSTPDSQQLSISNCETETETHAQPADMMGKQHKLHHRSGEHQKAPFMEGSASADTAGSMPADALAGAPTESLPSTLTSDCTFEMSSSACSALSSKVELNARRSVLPLVESRRDMLFKVGKQKLLVPRHHCYQRHRPYQINALNTRLNICML